jgi:hypothetical protein
MNRTIVLASFAALAVAGFSCAHGATTAFIRPTLAYVAPEADGYDDAAYVGFSAGVFTGPGKQHEFSAEIGATGWEFDEREFGLRVQGEESYASLLVSYRYYTQPIDSHVRFFFGPSLGFTTAQYEIEVSGPGIFRKDDSSEVLFTASANVGINFRFDEKLSLNVAYRYLYIASGETELLGVDVDLEASKAHVVFAALNIRF